MPQLIEDLKLAPCPNPWCPYPNGLNLVGDCAIFETRDAYDGYYKITEEAKGRHGFGCLCGVRTPMFNTQAEAVTAWNLPPRS